MQVNQGLTSTVVTANGKSQQFSATTPHFDAVNVSKEGKLSVEYAKARMAINLDYKENSRHNQALAKRVRKMCKETVVEVLGGKVSTKTETLEGGKIEKKLLVTFPDQSVARL